MRLFASDTLSWAKVETVSYNMFLQKDWKHLGVFCEYATSKGYDYYYLRVRAGIAYFQQKQFRNAITHFEKAATFDNNDFVKEYLYYCYLYSDRFEAARHLSKTFDPELHSYMKINKSIITSISVEGAVKISNDKLYNNGLYSQLNFTHNVFKDLSAFHAITGFTQDEWRFSVKQYQYYLQIKKPLSHNFLLVTAVHFITYQAVVFDTNYVEKPAFPAPLLSKEPYTSSKNANGYIGALMLTKHTPLFDYSIGATIAFLDTTTHLQFNPSVTWYPLHNNKLSVVANVFAHTNDNFVSRYVAVSPSVNYYFNPKIFCSLSYFINNGQNIIENNGYFVNNSIDRTVSRWSGSASARVSKKINLYCTYAFENKEDSRIPYSYAYHIWLVGIKIIP